jgi:hypothetical protein
MRRAVFVDRAWPAREDYCFGFEVADGDDFRVERMDFTIDSQFANASRYQLSVLRAEIEYQDGLERNGHEIAPFSLPTDFWLSKMSGDRL